MHNRKKKMAFVNNEEFYVWRGGGETGDELYISFKRQGVETSIPVVLFDELVVMRHAQLLENLMLDKIQKRAYKNHYGSLSCEALARLMGKPTALGNLLKITKSKKK